MRRMTGFLCLGVALVATANAAEPPPWLSQMDAVNISTDVGRKIPGVSDVNITPFPYDTNLHRWVTLIVPGAGERFIVTIDEATGNVCALYEHRDDCAATGSASAQIAAAKARFQAREDAARAPAPDIDGLLIVLLQSLGPKPGAAPTAPADWYITVKSADGSVVDPSPGVLAAVHMDGVHLMAGSKAPTQVDPHALTTGTMRYGIDTPLKRPDGNYDVAYSYYCGPLCAAGFVAVMSHDAQGWHIVSTTMNWVS